jgi:predicted TIM-barrel fold metal-dependent hydrolase
VRFFTWTALYLLLVAGLLAGCGDDADTAVFGAPHALRCAYDFFGAEQMLFASDMPFDPVQGSFIRDTIADVEALELPAAEREKIYEGNARELLRVPAPS